MNTITNRIRNSKGFTLIEIVIVMVILGILAIVAVPKFVDLTSTAKESATKEALGAIRSVLAVEYAKAASTGSPAFPDALDGTNFANGVVPTNKLNGNNEVGVLDAAPAGTATHADDGFWYIIATGVAGAYSDGSVDTSAY